MTEWHKARKAITWNWDSTCRKCNPRQPEFRIRKLPLLNSAPWTILSPRRLQMVGCLGYTYSDGMWAYPFKEQQYALFALENALKRETK